MKKVFFALILGLAGVNSAQGDDGRERYVEECLSVIGRPTVMVTSSYGKLKYNFDKDGAYLRRETEKKYQESATGIRAFIRRKLTRIWGIMFRQFIF